LGFCPDLSLSRPLCRGSGLAWESGPGDKGIRFLPAPGLQTPWIAFQGTADQVCDPAATQAYVRQVGGAEIVMLPKVGHGFSVQANWMPQFRQTFSKLVRQAGESERPTAPSVADLPLVEVPAPGSSSASLAVMLSGDGGWASLDREGAEVLAARGIPVVGLDTLRYFWKRRTPEESAQALQRILEHYLTTWEKTSVILVGYSRGADVLPFMANRLSEKMLSQVSLIALLGPGLAVDFEFHLTEWLSEPRGASARPVMPEVEKLRGRKILCVYGQQEAESLCPKLEKDLVILDARPGTHHFGGDYEGIASRTLEAASK